MLSIPEYVVQMIRRKAPSDCEFLGGSTPVVSFGDFRKVRVATLGINPSNREFLKPNGDWLPEEERRLATLTSLNADSTETLTDEQVADVFETSNNYFNRNPYRAWFDYFEDCLQHAFQASYYDGSACHLDLSQWATQEKWGELSKHQQELLRNDGASHLRKQLESENITHVIVNGRSVWDEIERSGIAEFKDVGTTTFSRKDTKCTLRIGFGAGAKFMGWTTNIPSSPGSTEKKFRSELRNWLLHNK